VPHHGDPSPGREHGGEPPIAGWRWAGAVASLGCVAAAVYEHRVVERTDLAWWWLGASVLLAIVWTRGVVFMRPAPDTRAAPEPVAAARRRRIARGGSLALGGAILWSAATIALWRDWQAYFDQAWLSWIAAAALLGIGLDFASGPWTRTRRARGTWVAVLLLLVIVAALYRLGNISVFPGEGTMMQVEDLQTGQWGDLYRHGDRMRWEYLSHEWLAGLGIWLGGPTMFAMRVPFAVVSVLKAVPLFLWLAFTAGPAGAAVGTALYTFSAWDVILSRTANNQNALIVASAFALLAGPVRRGRPSAYVVLGLLGGYLLHEYIAYRPLILLSLVGAAWLSLRDRRASWRVRVARPALTLALIVCMGIPLFLGRLNGDRVRIWNEYLDGWNRAHASEYYAPADDWQTALRKRVDRSFLAVGLFFFTGDSHPGRVVSQPMLDPITGAFVLLGVGCAIARFTQPIFALTIAGLAITVAGTLVATGNFDVGRVGGAVPYVYACAGFGAASLAALARGGARRSRMALYALLTAAVLYAGYLNTSALFEYWSSPSVHRALRSNQAYLASWLHRNVRDGEQVVAIAPGYTQVLREGDAGWLRGDEMPGITTWDIDSALRYWSAHPEKTLLLDFAGSATPSVQRYLEWAVPGLQLQFEGDPLNLGGELAYGHLEQMPARATDAIEASRCHGLRAHYSLVDDAGTDRVTMKGTAPLIGDATIPGELRDAIERAESRPRAVTARFDGEFAIAEAGDYQFVAQTYPGKAQLEIDGHPLDDSANQSVNLTAGQHRVEMRAELEPEPLALTVRLLWKGPDSNQEQEIIPFYRIAPVDPACAARTAGAADAPAVH
jgi:hypothetical protein